MQVIDRMRANLAAHLHYHNVDHTLYVLDQVRKISSKEGVSDKDLLLLEIAALYHDTGYMEQDKDHEELSCTIVRKELQGKLPETELDLICGMIMATKVPQCPKTKLEEVLADADLEYLGSKHFEEFGHLLFKELQHSYPDLTLKRWNEVQVEFLQSHKYHTSYCKQYKKKYKQKNLRGLLAKV